MTTNVGERADDHPYATWDGAYVLGALSDAERREYEAHMSSCDSCRTAVAELNDIPPLLSLLDADEVMALDEDAPEPPPVRSDVVVSLADAVTRKRRRSRIVTTGVSAVAATLLGIGLVVVAQPGTIGLQRQEPVPAAIAMEQVVPSPVEATFSLTSKDWGTEINMTCTYGAYENRYEKPGEFALVVVGRDGTRAQAATWKAAPNTSVTLDGSTSMPTNQIRSVELVSTETNDVLLKHTL